MNRSLQRVNCPVHSLKAKRPVYLLIILKIHMNHKVIGGILVISTLTYAVRAAVLNLPALGTDFFICFGLMAIGMLLVLTD